MKSIASCRVIALTRDPRDTVVSNYFQTVKREGGYSGELSDYIREDYFGIEKVCAFNVQLYAHLLRSRGSLVIKYETLLAEPAVCLRDVTRFLLGKPVAWERATSVAAANGFDSLQDKERKGELSRKYGNRFGSADPSDAESLKVRRGVAGGYGDYLCVEDLTYCEEVMSRWGYMPAALNDWQYGVISV